MTAYMISYDLNQPGQDYDTLYDAIKDLGKWFHCLDSTWVVTSTRSASDLAEHLTQFIDGSDKLIVARLTGEAAWFGFTSDGTEWLQANL